MCFHVTTQTPCTCMYASIHVTSHTPCTCVYTSTHVTTQTLCTCVHTCLCDHPNPMYTCVRDHPIPVCMCTHEYVCVTIPNPCHVCTYVCLCDHPNPRDHQNLQDQCHCASCLAPPSNHTQTLGTIHRTMAWKAPECPPAQHQALGCHLTV